MDTSTVARVEADREESTTTGWLVDYQEEESTALVEDIADRE